MLKDNLRLARKKASKTQEDVASFLNIKRQTYSAYERGISTPDAITLKKLASFFDVSFDDLLIDEPKNKPVPPEEDELAKLLEDPETREFYELIKDFSDDELEDLLNYGQYLIAKRDSKKKP
nr:MAG TPA: helix-turn-helix domain protein [Caudoviricetes sp.]